MKKTAIILAGGTGSRAGKGVPKQFRKLLGIPMLWWSVRAFHQEDSNVEILIVMHKDYLQDWDRLYSKLPVSDRQIPVRVINGGGDRTHSVLNGIRFTESSKDSLIAVHDAARPLINKEWITKLWTLAETTGSAVPCCPESNSLRRYYEDTTVPVNRNEYLTVQTPQIFRSDILHDAYSSVAENGSYTDDASLVQDKGYDISIAEGLPENLKVTHYTDFIIAESLLTHLKTIG